VLSMNFCEQMSLIGCQAPAHEQSARYTRFRDQLVESILSYPFIKRVSRGLGAVQSCWRARRHCKTMEGQLVDPCHGGVGTLDGIEYSLGDDTRRKTKVNLKRQEDRLLSRIANSSDESCRPGTAISSIPTAAAGGVHRVNSG
jgi:hypothetical protein